jgi:hypothetical protein
MLFFSPSIFFSQMCGPKLGTIYMVAMLATLKEYVMLTLYSIHFSSTVDLHRRD